MLIPREVAPILRPELPALAEEIVAAVIAERSEYGEILTSPEGVAIRLGLEQALHQFVDLVEQPERTRSGEAADLYRQLGRAQLEAGRTLEEVRTVFRIGVRLGWRRAAAVAEANGLGSGTLTALAEAIFAYGDQLIGEVVDGYARAQSDEAGERARHRRRLAAMLLDPDGHDPAALRRAAALAAWRLPQTLAALAVATDAPGAIASHLDAASTLPGIDEGGSWILLADPDAPGRSPAALTRALGDTAAALGPTVTLDDAPRTLRLARQALALVLRGVLPAAVPTRADDHLATIVIHQDPELARTLAERRLAPLLRAARPAGARRSPRRSPRGSLTSAMSRRSRRSCTSTRRPCATG